MKQSISFSREDAIDVIQTISKSVAAPFMNQDEDGNVILDENETRLFLPTAVINRLSNPAFTTQSPDAMGSATTTNLHLIPSTTTETGEAATLDDLVKRHFNNATWNATVEEAMIQEGFHKHKPTTDNTENQYSGQRSPFRDDLFSVRVDNLPEEWETRDLEEELKEVGCNYYTKCFIPHDEENRSRRFGFAKFEHLRYALMLLENNRTIKPKSGSMILSLSLVP